MKLVVDDDGRINQRIIAKLVKTDYLREVEAAQRKMKVNFSSPEVKRAYLRFFDSMQRNMHFILVHARMRVPEDAVEQVEASVREQLTQLTQEVSTDIAAAEVLYQQNGITSPAEYAVAPLAVEARVMSSFARQYLDLMQKVDQLMPMLETLVIDGLITQRQLNMRKGRLRRVVRAPAGTARNLAGGLRRRYFNDARGKPGASAPAELADMPPVLEPKAEAVAA